MADCPKESLNSAFPQQTTTSTIGLQVSTDGGGLSSVLNVNKLASAVQNYNLLNSAVNQLIGYEARWFRALPQQRSKDVIFLEYTLSNVEDCPIDIKVIVPSGMPPDSKYNFDLMGLEYEVPFEVQIDKKYWESLAGMGTAPQKKDIVYFPISNKIFEVESCYLFRGFMEQETTWKLNLKKYSPEASRKESVGLHETIDKYTVSVEEVFGGAIADDIKKLVDDQQMSQFSGTSKDKYKYFDASLRTIPSAINMYGTVVAHSFYDMQTSEVFNAINYNVTDIIHTNDDRSIIAWISPRTIPDIHKEYNVTSITENLYIDPSTIFTSNYDIVINSLKRFNIEDTLVIFRPGALNLYAKIVSISENPLVYHCEIDAFVLEDLQTIRANWASLPNYKAMVKFPINLIDGINQLEEHNFSANIYANQYIKVNYGAQTYISKLTNKLLDNKWYGIVINIGNTWEQYSINVWEKHTNDANAKLQRIFNETMTFYPEEVTVYNFVVNKSPAYLTNLKIYTSTIEDEKQSNDLLSYFTPNADQIVLADNADSILRLPYISRQR